MRCRLPPRPGDRDQDKLPDRWEKRFHTFAKQGSAGRDLDRDGLTNFGEYRSGTHPRRSDSDHDRVRDNDEDADRDRVDNATEIREGTKPRDRDSDDDRRRDGREDRDRDGLDNAGEDATGNDPIDSDTDGDKVRDGAENAGVVASFRNGALTLELADGRRITGVVDEFTDIDCDSERATEARYARHARRGTGHGSGHGPGRGAIPRARFAQSGVEGDEGEEPADEPGDESDEPGDEGDEPGDEGHDGDEPGDGGDGGGADSDGRGDCTTVGLVPGARVHEAEVIVTAGGLEFTAIELLR